MLESFGLELHRRSQLSTVVAKGYLGLFEKRRCVCNIAADLLLTMRFILCTLQGQQYLLRVDRSILVVLTFRNVLFQFAKEATLRLRHEFVCCKSFLLSNCA